MASAVGSQLIEHGVEGVVLVDGFQRIQARVERGTVVELLAGPLDQSQAAH